MPPSQVCSPMRSCPGRPRWDVFGDGCLILHTVEIESLEPVEEWLITKGFRTSQDMSETLPGSEASILISYALGMDPYETGPAKMPLVEFTKGQLAMRFFAGRPDVDYKVEVSDDLSEWEETGVLVSEADASGGKNCPRDWRGEQEFLEVGLFIGRLVLKSLRYRGEAF